MSGHVQSAVLWFTLWALVAAALGQILRLLIKAVRLLDSIVTVVRDVQELKTAWQEHKEQHRREATPPIPTTSGA